jgi:hypothetical protein
MYHLSLAKLLLYPKSTHLIQTFSLPDPLDIYGIYCSRYEFESALLIATLFELDLEKTITSCCDLIVRLINHLPWYAFEFILVLYLIKKNLLRVMLHRFHALG